MKITSSKLKKSQTAKITNNVFARVSSKRITKKQSSIVFNLNEELEKNKI